MGMTLYRDRKMLQSKLRGETTGAENTGKNLDNVLSN